MSETSQQKGFVITIDGPAGAGKSTVAKMLAQRLSFLYLDTGALYRAIAWQATKEGIDLEDESALVNLCRSLKLYHHPTNMSLCVEVAGEDVSGMIRTEQISLAASKISAFPSVRQALLPLQRDMGRRGKLVAEGRDMGTVVFPEAACKFFLDADVQERSRRRFLELSERFSPVDLEELKKDMIRRDRQDRERSAAPLVPAEDAIIIDSTNKTADEVVEYMLESIAQAHTGILRIP